MPTLPPDWSYLFGCCIAEIKSQKEPIVSLTRKKFELPTAITRRRDFIKFIKGQVVGQRSDEQQEYLMVATQKGFISLFRDERRVSYLYVPDLMVADMAYAEKYVSKYFLDFLTLKNQNVCHKSKNVPKIKKFQVSKILYKNQKICQK